MIFQPAIIALLSASMLGVAMLLAAAPFAVQLIRRWDIGSGSELQLTLERRTYLFSTLVAFVLALQLAQLLLFVFNADRMAALFVGAMCAVGTLRVNAWGFPALIAQMAMFFLAAMWLAINHVDTRGRDYPLVKLKYALLIGLLPVLAAVLALQWLYFSNLRADVITSCCGSLFSGAAKGLSADLSALPPRPAMAGFYFALAAAIVANGRAALLRAGGWMAAAASAVAFVAAIGGIVSFVSLYVYEHPHHHCPFCLLKPEYGWQGYWLYVPLFAATAAGLSAGAIRPFVRVASIADVVPAVAARLSTIAAVGFTLFLIAASLMIHRSGLILLEG